MPGQSELGSIVRAVSPFSAMTGNPASMRWMSTDDQLRDVVLDPAPRAPVSDRRTTAAAFSSLRVYDLDLQRLAVYDLQNLVNRSDGACSPLPNSGSSCNFLGAHSGVVDDNDMVYVMNGFAAIVVLDGTLPPEF